MSVSRALRYAYITDHSLCTDAVQSERARAELQREVDDLTERVMAAGSATEAQIEANRRRDAELAKV